MLNKNLTNFRRTLLIGIVITTIIANNLPLWERLALGQATFILFILIVGIYLFEVALRSVGGRSE